MLITRSVIRSLFHRLIRIDRASMLTMGMWITGTCHIRQLFFIASNVLICISGMVLVVLIMTSLINPIASSCWRWLLSTVLSCILLVFHECVIAWRESSSIKLLLISQLLLLTWMEWVRSSSIMLSLNTWMRRFCGTRLLLRRCTFHIARLSIRRLLSRSIIPCLTWVLLMWPRTWYFTWMRMRKLRVICIRYHALIWLNWLIWTNKADICR